MAKKKHLYATISENVNLGFRISTRIYHFVHRHKRIRQFPIIINNFNRLEWLKQQINWLRSIGQNNIHIIDNLSTYSSLLDYYRRVPATVYFLDRNKGHEALWRTHIFQRLGKYYYVYTDPDVLPTENTPNDFMQYFMDVLNRYPQMDKIGFGLQMDDLPDHYPRKSQVIQWESSLLEKELEPGLFHAKIDTTFALYRPHRAFQKWETTIRCDKPYVLRHMPWYENPAKPSEEERHFKESTSDASSWYRKQ